MTTAEKLLVQIFERKNSFIDQVKQQAELYYHHCASKLLIDGITPPSWLWSPNTSPESKDLNKEELISKLLRPYRQPPGRCSVGLYPVNNNIAVTGDNEDFSDGVLLENLAFSKGLNRQDDPTATVLNSEDHGPCVTNFAHELDTSINSPAVTGDNEDFSDGVLLENLAFSKGLNRQDDPTATVLNREDHGPSVTNFAHELDTSINSPEYLNDERISNIYNAPDQSITGIQRSKSRQKALELRNSAKALPNSSLRHENTSDRFSSQVRFSLSATNQSSQKEEQQQLAEPCLVGSQICDILDLSEADCISKENGMAYSGRISRSKSGAKVPVCVRVSTTLGCSSRDCKDNSTSHVVKEWRTPSIPISDSEQADDYVYKLPKSARPSIVCSQSCGGKKVDVADCLSNGEHENTSDCFSSQVRFSLSATNQSGQKEEQPQLAEPCLVGSQICDTLDLSEADCISKENGMAYSGRISRSKSGAKVPVCVRVSTTLGCSSPDCKENSTSQVVKDWRTPSIHISDSEQAGDYVYKLPKSAGPSIVCSQGCGGKKLDVADCFSNGEVYSCAITRSKASAKHQCDCHSSNAECSYGDYEKIGSSMMDCGDGMPPDHVNGLLTNVNPFHALNEGCDARLSTSAGSKSHRERFAQQNASIDDISDLSISSQSAKADGVILAPSSERSALAVNNTNEVQGLVKPSVGLPCNVKSSQTLSNGEKTHEPVPYNEIPSSGGLKSKSDCKLVSAAIDELQNTSSGQFIPPCHGNQDMLEERKNPSFVISEFVLHDHVNLPGSCSYSDPKQRRMLDSEVALTRSDSLVIMDPKQLGFNEIEECNLEAINSSSGKRRLDKSLERMSCSLSVSPVVSLDKEIFGGIDKLSLGKQSTGISDVSSKREEAQKDGFESDVVANPDNEEFGSVVRDTVLKTPKDNNEVGLNCELSEVYHEGDSTSSKMVDIPGVKYDAEHGVESTPERHLEEGNWNCEGKDKDQLVSSATQSENFSPSHYHNSAEKPITESSDCLIGKTEMTMPICVGLDKMKQLPSQQSHILSLNQHVDSSTRVEELATSSAVRSPGDVSLENSFRQASMESWPQIKRRKIDHQQTHSFTTSPIFRVRKPNNNGSGPASMHLENIKISTDTVSLDTFHVKESTNTPMHKELNSDLIEGLASSFLSQNEEVEFCYKEKNDSKSPLAVIFNEQSGVAPVSSLIKEPRRNSEGCSHEGMRTESPSSNHFDARGLGDGQYSMHLYNIDKNNEHQNSASLTCINKMLEKIQSPKSDGSLQLQHCVLSPSNEVMERIDVDQAMPVLEGFIIDGPSDDDRLDIAADEIDFDKLGLRGTTIERASILAEICRSTSLDKSLSHFSSTFEFQETQNVFQSVSSSHLECLDLSTFPTSSGIGKQRQSSGCSGDDYMDTVEGMPYSDYPAYSGAKYYWSSKSQYTSPVGKLWERLSSHTGSSGKRVSSNPELTCFPIEEDPGTSEENKTVDENADHVQEEIDSSWANHCAKKQPLEDLTNLCLDPPMSVSAMKETPRADGVNFVKAKLSVAGTQDKVLSSKKNEFLNRREIREKQTSFIGDTDGRRKQTSSISTNGIRKAKDSINNSTSKPLVSKKTSLKRQDQKHSLKDSRRNNILSNVSSFIPLIQKKQEAAVCAGKRDVKVKALETAEAAKRLEEKKENERKMRKEALKLERAKLEEKNLKLMELEKEKREVERKKKDADIISKKRLREEEERKEKEKKKMRLEVRQQQREQQEKMHAEKAEKENQRRKDEQMNRKKEFHKESTKQQDRKATGGDNMALSMTEAKLTPTEVVMNYEECSTSDQSCEAGKAMQVVDKSPRNEDMIVRDKGNSYDISPYQCSDDEDEEDDELPTKKYIPSWASKTSVALLLPLQQEMHPDTIFPPESFCSMDEVLLPRKLT